MTDQPTSPAFTVPRLPTLIEYAAVEVHDGFQPATWVNGERQTHWGSGVHAWAVEQAVEQALSLAVDFLGRGGVTVRLRVESPAPLSMESTVAELAEFVERMQATEVTAAFSGKHTPRWIAAAVTSEDHRFLGAGDTAIPAILEALRRVGGQ